jgi:hypothetical protein
MTTRQTIKQRIALAKHRRTKVVNFIRAAFESLSRYRLVISPEGSVRFQPEVLCSRDL